MTKRWYILQFINLKLLAIGSQVHALQQFEEEVPLWNEPHGVNSIGKRDGTCESGSHPYEYAH